MQQHIVLVLNAGSSSLKYQMVRVPDGERLLRGKIDRVRRNGFSNAIDLVIEEIRSAGLVEAVTAIGHRVVHGGARHVAPAAVDDGLIASVHDLGRLAPLHNPPAAEGMRRTLATFPHLPQVAVFDTAFFAGLPEVARTYAIDPDVAAANDVRRYGMHGTSHQYVAGRVAAVLGHSPHALDQIVLHLGNGASATALRAGRPVDTSMGLTPLEGLVMGTRAGDLDPGILLHLLRHGRLDLEQLDDVLNERSGLKGLAGSSDVRDLMAGVDAGEPRAQLAYEIYCHRIRKYVGAYLAVLGGADAITFTAGVGEHEPKVRHGALRGLEWLGIVVDPERNNSMAQGERLISSDDSAVAVLVVPTDEELAIAFQVVDLLEP